MPCIHLGNEKIHYELNASTAATALIPIHGSGGCGAHWPRELRDISHFRVYIPDLPGHGRSTGNGRNRVDDYADVIDAFVTTLNLRHVILMGHSLGGAIALTSALRAPAWLSGLILVGTGARLRVTRTILDGLLSDYDKTVNIICKVIFGPAAPPSLIEHIRTQLLITDPRIVHGDFSACDQFDAMNLISEIQVPTLVISGTEDKLTPAKYGDFMCSRIPGAVHRIIASAGHLMALEQPADFISAITNSFPPPQIAGKSGEPPQANTRLSGY
jgi:pimeloyl-ACP methyl ester carboxylesterase